MKNRLSKSLVAWFVIPLALPVLGQAPAGQAPTPSDQPVMRVTTRLVQVNVIVQDKKGNPVTDLTRDDFQVLDEGQEQAIRIFSVESNQPLPTQPEPLPPNTFSNRLEQRAGAVTSVTAILLDGLNTRFSDQAYARNLDPHGFDRSVTVVTVVNVVNIVLRKKACHLINDLRRPHTAFALDPRLSGGASSLPRWR